MSPGQSPRIQERASLAGALLVVMCASLPGCSARSSAVVASPPPDVNSYSTLAVSVHSSVNDTAQEAAALATEILGQAKASGRFKEVRAAAARESKPRTLLLAANITKVKKVSGSKRLMFGVGAGRAHLIAQVELKDAKTGRVVGSFEVKGESGNSAFASGTDDAVSKAGRQVVTVLLGSSGTGTRSSKEVAAKKAN